MAETEGVPPVPPGQEWPAEIKDGEVQFHPTLRQIRICKRENRLDVSPKTTILSFAIVKSMAAEILAQEAATEMLIRR